MIIAMEGVKFDCPYCEFVFGRGGGDCAVTGMDESSSMMKRRKGMKRDELLLNFGAIS
jgi:hypothetical protein